MSDECHKKKPHRYLLVIVTDQYVLDESMMVDDDENGGSYRNEQTATTLSVHGPRAGIAATVTFRTMASVGPCPLRPRLGDSLIMSS